MAFKWNVLHRGNETQTVDLGEFGQEVYGPDWQEERYPDLRGLPAQDQRLILYDKMGCDAVIGVQRGLLKALPLFFTALVLLPALQTLAAGHLSRRYQRSWPVTVTYIERIIPFGLTLVWSVALVSGAFWYPATGAGDWFVRYQRSLADGGRGRRAGHGPGGGVPRMEMADPAVPTLRLDCPGNLGEIAVDLTPAWAVRRPRCAEESGSQAAHFEPRKNSPSLCHSPADGDGIDRVPSLSHRKAGRTSFNGGEFANDRRDTTGCTAVLHNLQLRGAVALGSADLPVLGFIHWPRRWLRLSAEQFDAINYTLMVLFKMGVVLFNLVPYIALRIVA